MNDASDRLAELHDLVGAHCEEILTATQAARLQELVIGNEELRYRYILYMHVHALAEMGRCLPASKLDRGSMDTAGLPFERPLCSDVSSSSSPVPGFLSNVAYGTVGYFSSGWPLAYLMATVISGIALVIGSLVHVSQPAQVASQSVPLPSRLSPLPSMVGRITGMVDCKWEEGSGFRVRGLEPVVSGQWSVASGQKQSESRSTSHQPPATSHLVSLGDKFALASGLMEITYDTGAKVILQGPVTYEVESAAGGYLSVGKLTARVEGRGARGKGSINLQISKSPNPSPHSSLPSPLFLVRTPTATVTDLGTEFGVEVEQSGVTESHVFAGKVKVLALATRNGLKGREVTLGENESVRVERSADGTGAPVGIHRGVAKPEGFVRTGQFARLREQSHLTPLRRWQAYSRQLRKDPALVAYYTFEAAGRSNAILPNQSSAGSALDGQVEGAEWVYGRLPGKFALLFHGPKSGDKVVLPDQERFNFTGAYTVAVWHKLRLSVPGFQAFVAKGNAAWRLQQFGDTPQFGTGDCYRSDFHQLNARTHGFDGRWRLLVAVCEPDDKGDSKRLYVNGKLEAEAHGVPRQLPGDDRPVWLGSNSVVPNFELDGWIDEVAVFSRALSADEIRAMFRAGDPAPAGKEGNAMNGP